jgi:hypothetical protein
MLGLTKMTNTREGDFWDLGVSALHAWISSGMVTDRVVIFQKGPEPLGILLPLVSAVRIHYIAWILRKPCRI